MYEAGVVAAHGTRCRIVVIDESIVSHRLVSHSHHHALVLASGGARSRVACRASCLGVLGLGRKEP